MPDQESPASLGEMGSGLRFEDAPELKDLPARWKESLMRVLAPGVAVAVIKDGKLYASATFGTRDSVTSLPVTPDTMFYIASITKTYVATAICVLVDQGKISLDDPVKKYLPRFVLADVDAGERLTIRDLLGHKPGISSTPIVTLDAYTGEITEDRYYHWLAEARPTGQTTYTNVHFTILGRVLEHVTGKSWKDAVDDLVLKPAGLTRTTGYASRLYADADHADPMEWNASGRFGAAELVKTDAVMHSAGGMGASLNDAVRYLCMHLQDGLIDGRRVLASESAILMRKEWSSIAPEEGWSVGTKTGFGLGWSTGTFHGRRLVQHDGGYSGATAIYAMLPDQKAGIVILTNAGVPPLVIAIDLLSRLTGEKEPPGLLDEFLKVSGQFRSEIEVKSATDLGGPLPFAGVTGDAAALVGVYTNTWWGTVRLRKVAEGLQVSIGTVDVRVKSTGKDGFEVAGPIFAENTARILPASGTAPAKIILSDPEVGDVTYER